MFKKNFLDLWRRIGTHGIMTLSTCSENRVISRPMSIVVIDSKFYCQTDITYMKSRQIAENPNVAVCYKNFSIEGICRMLDNPFQYDFFINAMRLHFNNAVDRWSALPTERVLEITPTMIYMWDYDKDDPYIEYWDFKNTAYCKKHMLKK